ncbi:MAG: SDR family NAD(P)-dependent oxidoreductase, partial [Phycisphaerales bacterium]|nr:SDR family NAD(P)-dependent oxidoreductase [Phycisphaerales bacterium]
MIRLPSKIAGSLRSAYDNRRVCVTGGAGFIGGHLVDALTSLGASVTVIDDLSNSNADHLSSLIELDPDRVRFIHGSILDPEAMERAAESASIVFHLAAICSVPRSVEDPARAWAVNATGVLRVLEAARHGGARRVVFSASSSAYGNATNMPVNEAVIPSPLSPYAASKLAGESLMTAYAESYGLSTISLRYFNIFGPRQPAGSPYSGVVPIFASMLLAGERLKILGDGGQTRDFTYVGNAVLANLLAGATQEPLAGQVVNIGAGVQTPILELARRMLE